MLASGHTRCIRHKTSLPKVKQAARRSRYLPLNTSLYHSVQRLRGEKVDPRSFRTLPFTKRGSFPHSHGPLSSSLLGVRVLTALFPQILRSLQAPIPSPQKSVFTARSCSSQTRVLLLLLSLRNRSLRCPVSRNPSLEAWVFNVLLLSLNSPKSYSSAFTS